MGSNRLRILSYNIRHGQGVGGLISSARVAEVLRRCDCNVAALTEVWRVPPYLDQPATLATLTGMQPLYHGLHRRFQGDSGNALLSHLPVSDVRYIDLGGRIERRGCLLATVRVDSRECCLGVVHLSLHRATRQAQIAQLAAELPRDVPLVLAGDFNCPRAQLGGLSSLLRWPAEEPATYPSVLPYRALDHIGFSAEWRLESFSPIRSWASDHLPLLAELSLVPVAKPDGEVPAGRVETVPKVPM